MALPGLCLALEAMGRVCTRVHVYSWKKEFLKIEHTDQITLPGLGSHVEGVYRCTCVQLEEKIENWKLNILTRWLWFDFAQIGKPCGRCVHVYMCTVGRKKLGSLKLNILTRSLCPAWEALGRVCTCVHVYSWK